MHTEVAAGTSSDAPMHDAGDIYDNWPCHGGCQYLGIICAENFVGNI